MSNLWHKVRCSRLLDTHRWEEKRIEGEKAFECRDCHKRHFGSHPPVSILNAALGGPVDGGGAGVGHGGGLGGHGGH